ncbi:hypothetical protein LWI28_015780 [Acer negundo]|uniref:Ubiquitin-like domain-containing protein n=1 Tax=Acer negundo TaxID=4023 RepID=A0AAD5JJA2_ACENE|nr:hypothetical protein LWI28_015780 [Acer negundo]
MIEVVLNDRLGKKVHLKCNDDDKIDDLKKLVTVQMGTRPDKIRIHKWIEIDPRTYLEEKSGLQSDDELEDSSSIVKENSGEREKDFKLYPYSLARRRATKSFAVNLN